MNDLPLWEDLAELGDLRRMWESLGRAQPAQLLQAGRGKYGADHWQRADCPAWWRRLMAECLWRSGQSAEARVMLLELRQQADLPPCISAWVELNLSELDKGGESLDPPLQSRHEVRLLAQQAQRPDIAAMVDLLDGIDAYLAGDYATALQFYEQAGTTFRQLQMPVEEAGVIGNRALAMHALGDFKAAIRDYQRTVELAQCSDDRLAVGRAHYNLSCLLRDMGDYDGASAELDAALLVMQELGHERGRAMISNAMGVLYFRMGRHSDAIDAYRTAIRWKEQAGAVSEYASSYVSLAECLLQTGAVEQAREAFEKARHYVESYGPARLRWSCDLGLAHVAFRCAHYEQVGKPLLEAITCLKTAGETLYLYESLAHLLDWATTVDDQWMAALQTAACEVLDLPTDGEEAIAALFAAAISGSRAIAAMPLLARLLGIHARWLESQGRLSEAIAAIRESHAMDRAQLNDASERRRAALTVRYELERSHQLALAEQRQKELLQAALDRMVKSHTDKQELLEMVAHDLRNGLGAIRVTASMLTSPLSAAMPEEQRDQALGDLHEIASGLLQSLNDMLAGASVHDATDRPAVDLLRLVNNVADLHRPIASRRRINVHCHIGETEVWLSQPVAWLRAVIDNLLTNAIRHAPEGSDVRITLSCDDAMCSVAVEDSGSGVELSKVPLLFNRYGMVAEPDNGGSGIGLSIVNRLVERMDGCCSYAAAPCGGACFTVALPLRPPAQVRQSGLAR